MGVILICLLLRGIVTEIDSGFQNQGTPMKMPEMPEGSSRSHVFPLLLVGES